jgi:hypothetical protein
MDKKEAMKIVYDNLSIRDDERLEEAVETLEESLGLVPVYEPSDDPTGKQELIYMEGEELLRHLFDE